MRKIHKAEARLVELQSVTKQKAGELFYCFIEAFGDARKYLAQLRGEYGKAKQNTRRIRGIIILDKASDKLKEKGLLSARSPAGSEDMRDSIVETDPEYIETFDRFCQVEAALEHMEGKVEKLKMAYYAISDLIKGTDLTKRETSGGVGDDDPGSLTKSEKLHQFVNEHSVVGAEASTYEDLGFGVPKF
jgi:hypothetical protein